jgi:hypothetical protein
MTTFAPDAVLEADELRSELELLEDAIARLRAEVDQARSDRDGARVLLDEAIEFRYVLEDRLVELEDALLLERLRAEIRRKLIAGITDAGVLQRRKAIARAVRVERLLGA